MLTKLAFIGESGSGISTVADLFLEKYYNVYHNDYGYRNNPIRSFKIGEFEIFDIKGLDYSSDINSIQKMISRLQEEKINAIFFVIKINERIHQKLKITFEQICRLFKGKYIWKQIGIIFTHSYNNIKEEHKERGKKFIQEVLNIVENEYKEIIRTQDPNNRICDPNEKLVDNLNCFYIKIPEEGEYYDDYSIKEIKRIKSLVKYYPPITLVQSEFIVKKEIIKDIKTAVERNGEESGVYSVLRENKGLAFGLGLGLFVSPLTVLGGLVAGGIVNKTVEVYDEEVIYWSTGRIEKNKINIRHQNLLGNEI